ncbi:MAG TPA: hypothetical protein VJ964_00035 [Balneolaceae bacterium]|nr:hypothetical protein [Balneolaceae bacterium]
MSRASEYIDFINRRKLPDNTNLYYQTRLTSLTVSDTLKAARKSYLKRIGIGYARPVHTK